MKPTKQDRAAKSAPAESTPPPQLSPTSPLAGYFSIEEYQAARSAILPTINALRWFVSENREELLEADALRQHRGRLMLHGERTDRIVDKVGKDAAVRRFKGNADVLQDDRESQAAGGRISWPAKPSRANLR